MHLSHAPKRSILSQALSYFWMTLGAFLAAFALEVFFIPNKLIDGGIVGIAMIFGKLFGPKLIPLISILLNIPFLVLAYRSIGKSFAIHMVVANILFSISMVAIPHFLHMQFLGDSLEVAVIGGAILGVGIGLIIREGGCLDGTEILGIIINRRTGLTVGQIVLACNIFVFGAAGLVFQDLHPPLMSLITYIVVIKIMDAVIVGLDETKSVIIISSKSKPIADAIIHELGLGLTVMYGRGGFSGAEREILYVIAERLQLAELKELVLREDPSAFIAIENLHEVANGKPAKEEKMTRAENIFFRLFKNSPKMSSVPPLTFEEIQHIALSLGWDDLAVTDPTIPQEDSDFYEEWLAKSYHGNLAYMENKIRIAPTQLFPGAKTAILFASYYKQEKKAFKDNQGLIASYARGRDYHTVHRKRLKKFIAWLEQRMQQTNIAKGFSDSTPILEKALAIKAGMGWFGKNTLMIHRKFGTFFLLSGILTTVELEHSSFVQNSTRTARCGSCTRCLDACPTQAFISPYQLDATKCLSYHLIESKESLPDFVQANNPGYVFGCDICQDVCPHNQRKPLSLHEEFNEEKGIGAYISLEKFHHIETQPETLFGTPLQRRGVQGLLKTLQSLKIK